MIELSIKSKPENVALACAEARNAAIAAGMPDQAVSELELAVSEAVTNSIEHGYQWQEDQDILVKIETLNNQLVVNISDQGSPIPGDLFDNIEEGFEEPTSQSNGDEIDQMVDPMALLAENGRGLKIIQALVDNIHSQHKDGWNILKLIKNV